jgi:hypothetical protein
VSGFDRFRGYTSEEKLVSDDWRQIKLGGTDDNFPGETTPFVSVVPLKIDSPAAANFAHPSITINYFAVVFAIHLHRFAHLV